MARRCPWPRSISRWCRCLSAVATLERRLARTDDGEGRVEQRTPRITNGITSGAKKNHDWPRERIVGLTADGDRRRRESSSPSSNAPFAQAKMLAGLKLERQKPRHTPAVTIAISTDVGDADDADPEQLPAVE